MKILDGAELASYIESQQAQRVRFLKQAKNKHPEITLTKSTLEQFPSTNAYGEDIGVTVKSGSADSVDAAQATATAITWLLAGYNVNLPGKHIVIVDDGKPASKALADLWLDSDLGVTFLKSDAPNLSDVLSKVDVLIDLSMLLDELTDAVLMPTAAVVSAKLNQIAQDQPKLLYADSFNLEDLIVCALFATVLTES